MAKSTQVFNLFKNFQKTKSWQSYTDEQKSEIEKEVDETHKYLLDKEVSRQEPTISDSLLAPEGQRIPSLSDFTPEPMKTGAFPANKFAAPDFALETPGLSMPIMPRVASDTPALALPAKPSTNFAEQALNQLKTPYVKPVPTQEETGAPDAIYKIPDPILRKLQSVLKDNKGIVQPALRTAGAVVGGATGATMAPDPISKTLLAASMAQGGSDIVSKISQFAGIADADPTEEYNPNATATEGAKQTLKAGPELLKSFGNLKSPPLFFAKAGLDAAISMKQKLAEGKPVSEALVETGKENSVLALFHLLSKVVPGAAEMAKGYPTLAKTIQMAPGIVGTAMETPTLAAAAGEANTNNPVEALQKMAQMPGVPAAAFNAFAMPAADAQRIGAENKSAKIAETVRKMNEGLALIEGKAPEQAQPKAPIVRLPKIEKTDEATNKILADHEPFIESIIKMESAGAKPEEIKAAYDRKIAGIPEGLETYKESLIKSRDEAINDVMELNQEQPKTEPIPAPTLETKPESKAETPKTETIPEQSKEIVTPASEKTAPDLNKPILVSSRRQGSTIYLSFDSMGKIPTVAELKAQFPGNVEIAKFGEDIVSATRGITKFRIDVSDKNFANSSAEAKKTYEAALPGIPEEYHAKSEFESKIPLNERMGKVIEKSIDRELGIKRRPAASEKTSSLEPQPEAIIPPAKETIKAEPEIALPTPKSENGKVERRLELAQELQSRGLQSIYKKKVKGIGEQTFMKTSEMMERELAEFDAKNPDVAAKAQKVIKKAEPQPINTEIRVRPQMGELPVAPEPVIKKARKALKKSPEQKPEPTKEPWEMTLDEVNKTGFIAYDTGLNKFFVKKRTPTPSVESSNSSEHGRVVAAALKEGKPVPAEVLKDYPELLPGKAAEPLTKEIDAGVPRLTEQMIEKVKNKKTLIQKRAEILSMMSGESPTAKKYMAEKVLAHDPALYEFVKKGAGYEKEYFDKNGKEPIVIDEESYLAQNGASRQDIGDSAMHKNRGKSERAWQTLIKRQAEQDRILVEKRAELRKEYAAKVEAGELRPPTSKERLEATAAGMPENAAVQAAKRVIEKRAARKSSATKLNTVESLIAEGIYDVAKKGASLIKSGTKDFYQWSKAMMKEYGPKIKGRIVKLWEAAKELATGGIIGTKRGMVTLKDKLGFKSQPKELFDTNMEKLEADQNKPKKTKQIEAEETDKTELEARKRAGLPMGRGEEVKLTRLEKAKQVIQNILEPVEKAQKIFGKGKEIPEEMDTILAADMVKKRIENQLENIKENGEDPLVEEIHKSNLEYKEVEDWLKAKNALEMNPKIVKLNPKFRASATEAGTGMDSGKAALIIAKLTNEGKAERLDAIAEKVYALSAMQREALVKYGLKSPEEIKLWEERKFYVPSKGLPNISDWTLSDRTPLGKGFDQSGQIVKRQLGRKTPSTAPIAHLLEQLNATIIRGERNLVGQKFLAFAEANPDKSLWEINKLEQKQVIDKETGQVIDITDKAAELKDDHLVVYRNGEKFVVKIIDPDMAAGMKKLGAKTNPVLRMAMAAMKARGSTLTSHSFEFAFANTPRDAGEMYMNVATDHGPETATKILKSIPSVTKQVYQYLRGNKNVEIAADLEEFKRLGGETGYFNLKDVESQQSDIEGKLKDLANPNGIIPLTKKTLNYAVKYLGDISTASELGNRLAVFIELKKKDGPHKQLTPIRSAQYGKNVTVNFDREGLGGPWIKALWMFANAGIQGTARIAEAMSDLPKNTPKGQRSRKLVGSAIAGSAMLDQWNAAMSDDWDKMEQKYKNVNMTLMFPGGYRFMVPLPYGYAPLHTFGQQMSAMARGKMQPSEAAKNMVLSAASAFNPLGGDDDPRLWLLPTLAELPIETAFNKKIFTGKPIVPENMPFGPQKPDSERYPKGTSKHLIALTREANRLTGGDSVTPGAVDVSPATLEYLADYLGGSIGRTIRQTGQLIAETPGYISGETALPGPHQIPILRRFVGAPTPYADNRIFREIVADLNNYKAKKKIKTNKPEDAWKEDAILALEGYSEKGLAKYRKYSLKNQIEDLEDKITVESEKGNSREAEKLKDQVFQLKKKFNKRVEELKQVKK